MKKINEASLKKFDFCLYIKMKMQDFKKDNIYKEAKLDLILQKEMSGKGIKYNQLKKGFINLDQIIDYDPPKYIPNWDGSFKSHKYGKSFYIRPNKESSSFNLKIKDYNPLGISKESIGIYVIVNDLMNFFYVGKTINNIYQRLSSHIQKITATNNNKNTTPVKWQKLGFERYNKLQEKSVLIDDLQLSFYDLSEFEGYDIDDLEALIYLYNRETLRGHKSLNDPKQIKKLNQ